LLATKAKASTPTPTTSVLLQASKQASKNQAGLCFWSYSADQNKSSGPSLFHHEISFPLLPSSSLHSQKTPTKAEPKISPPENSSSSCRQVCVCVCVCVCVSLSLSLSVSHKTQIQNHNWRDTLNLFSVPLCPCVDFSVWNFTRQFPSLSRQQRSVQL
jgi:hypothetical protein